MLPVIINTLSKYIIIIGIIIFKRLSKNVKRYCEERSEVDNQPKGVY